MEIDFETLSAEDIDIWDTASLVAVLAIGGIGIAAADGFLTGWIPAYIIMGISIYLLVVPGIHTILVNYIFASPE